MSLTCLALVLLGQLAEERFEQPLVTPWGLPGASAVSRFSLTRTAAHSGSSGAQFDKPDAGPSSIVTLPPLTLDLNGPLPGELHFRVWFNLLAGPTTARVSPIQVGQGGVTFTLGELFVDQGGAGVWTLSCADDATGFRGVPVPAPVVAGQWTLLELDLEGVGTDAGTCRGAVDGVEASVPGFDWSGRGATLLVTGFNVVDDAWKGSYAIDDLTLTRVARAMRTRLVGPDVVDAGSCVPLRVEFLARDGGALPPPTTARFLASVTGGGLFTDPQCTLGVAATRVLAASEVATLYVAIAAPIATVDVNANDLLGATKVVARSATDAGTDGGADGGVDGGSDAGADGGVDGGIDAGAELHRLQVGCDCGAGDGGVVPWLLAAMLLLRQRR